MRSGHGCRAYLYIEGTAALESLANPGSVPVITGLAGAAGYTAKLTGAAGLAENLASDFLNLELRANAAAGGAGSDLPKAAWTIEDAVRQSVLIQSGSDTCGPPCAAYIANKLAFGTITEQSIIKAVGSDLTNAGELAGALTDQTGQTFIGGALARVVPEENMTAWVAARTNQGDQPFMTLFYGPNSSAASAGLWVVVEGVAPSGNIAILDPAGLQYTMQPDAFFSAWKWQNLVLKP